jgi:benzoylformate decarboxylase
MHPMAAVRAIIEALPAETTVVDEAVTSDPYIRAFHRVATPGRFFYSRGGGLGWGLPAALGVSLARGREPLLAVVGDGSFLYSPQAMWTAVREDLPVVTVVLNNSGYLILRRFLAQAAPAGQPALPGTELGITDPAVDPAALARGFGAQARRVDSLVDVGAAVRAALAAGQPALIEVPVAAPVSPG